MTTAPRPGPVHFGIAGWSYADWKGIVYPSSCRDTLKFCARYVDCIEINSTFYRLPDAGMSATWAARTADLPTFFTAKLPRVFTHDLRLAADDVATTRAGFAPLADAGKLRMLLAQFSHRFTDSPRHREHLAQLTASFDDVAPLAVEVRHRTWGEGPALEFLSGLGVSVTHLDYPGSDAGFGVRTTGILGPAQIAYLRLHGRNSNAWFRRDAGRDEIYDYLYQPDEVQQLVTRMGEIAAGAKQTVVIGNNHFQGQALKVTLELMAAWRGEKVDVPAGLLERYDDLAGIAQGRTRGLFG